MASDSSHVRANLRSPPPPPFVNPTPCNPPPPLIWGTVTVLFF